MVLAFRADLSVTGTSRCFTSGILTPSGCVLRVTVDDARRCRKRGRPYAQAVSPVLAGQGLSPIQASRYTHVIRVRTFAPEHGPAFTLGFQAPARDDHVSLKPAVAPELRAARTGPWRGGPS